VSDKSIEPKLKKEKHKVDDSATVDNKHSNDIQRFEEEDKHQSTTNFYLLPFQQYQVQLPVCQSIQCSAFSCQKLSQFDKLVLACPTSIPSCLVHSCWNLNSLDYIIAVYIVKKQRICISIYNLKSHSCRRYQDFHSFLSYHHCSHKTQSKGMS